MPMATETPQFDAVGNRTQLTDNLGGTTKASYNSRNWPTTITQTGSGVTTKRVDFTYNGTGFRTTLTRSLDLLGYNTFLTTQYFPDNADRLQSQADVTAAGLVRSTALAIFDKTTSTSMILLSVRPNDSIVVGSHGILASC
jgi:hypothetical protein